MSSRRFPQHVYGHGTEPDARFSLANERTFLAWVGAGLALISVGVGLDSLALDMHPSFRLAASVLLVLSGIAAAVSSWFGWMRAESALREHRALPFQPLILALPIVLAIVGLIIIAGMMVD